MFIDGQAKNTFAVWRGGMSLARHLSTLISAPPNGAPVDKRVEL